MKTIRSSSVAIILIAAFTLLAAKVARADSYSWKNFQSDIPGVAAHTDPNLVNPWGMAVNSTGTTIWVSDNGTGVSTLYKQDGTAQSLIVTIPTSIRNKGGANPTGIVKNSMPFFHVRHNGKSPPTRFIFVSE